MGLEQFTDPITGAVSDIVTDNTGSPISAIDQATNSNLGKLDGIQNKLASYDPVRAYSSALDTQLTGIETQIVATRTQMNALGSTANEGVGGMMADMQKQHISDCAAAGLAINDMFGKMMDGVNALANALVFEPIEAIIDKLQELLNGLPSFNLGAAIGDIVAAIDWLISNIFDAINDALGQIDAAIGDAISAVGDMLESLYEQSGLKEIATKLLGAIAAIAGCADDFLDGLGGLHPSVQNMMPPEMKAAKDAVEFAKSVASPTDTIGDIVNEAKMKGVADLDLDSQVDAVNSAIDGKVSAITDVINNPTVPTLPSIPTIPSLPGFA